MKHCTVGYLPLTLGSTSLLQGDLWLSCELRGMGKGTWARARAPRTVYGISLSYIGDEIWVIIFMYPQCDAHPSIQFLITSWL